MEWKKRGRVRGREAAKKAEREGLRGGDEIWQDGERYFCVWERCEWKGRKEKKKTPY